jgi:hypothetical protein
MSRQIHGTPSDLEEEEHPDEGEHHRSGHLLPGERPSTADPAQSEEGILNQEDSCQD